MARSTIRDLNAGDVIDLADILAECWDHLDFSLVQQAQQQSTAGDASLRMQVGQHIVGVALKYAREPLVRLVASLYEEDVEDLRKRPPTAILDALEAVLDSQEGRDFFEKGRSLLGTAGRT